VDFGLGTYGLSIAAGSLSTLSPCVLPLLPILLGAAVAAHRLGPFALAGGLMLSFTAVGVFVASLGAAIGLDQETFRNVAAVALVAFGGVLVSARLQEGFVVAASGVSGAGHGLLSRLTLDGLAGQFAIGLLLGLVWSPCVGPTLGAAVTLASQGQDLAQVALIMALFGLGAGLPLIVLGLASRETVSRIRGRLLAAGKLGKQVLGALMLLLGGAILSGADRLFEAWVLRTAPEWLVRLTTSL
jgi:cytochrome c biogenesis protein CcdA